MIGRSIVCNSFSMTVKNIDAIHRPQSSNFGEIGRGQRTSFIDAVKKTQLAEEAACEQ